MKEQLLKHLKESIGLLNSLRDRDNLLSTAEDIWCETVTNSFVEKYSPYISEVETFNNIFGKLNNYTPTTDIPEFEKKFIYDFLTEELNEYRAGYENNDIVEIADSFGDLMYVLSAGILVYGLKDKFPEIYQEIQRSNMSKSCKTEDEAKETVKYIEETKNYRCHYEQVGDLWIVFRTLDRKAQKSIYYSPPNLKQFFN